MDESRKRKAPPEGSHPPGKRSKPRTIEAGDSGIWATCNMGKEGKAVGELRDCFQEYVSKMYGSSHEAGDDDAAASDEEDGDVEAQIQKEVEGIKKPASDAAFEHVRVDTDCIMFFKTRAPIEPVSFVRRICEDALADPERKSSRFVKRLTPMTLMGKATESGLEEVARQVLGPHFHEKDGTSKKFAIRPNIRNNTVLTRNLVITRVAQMVGPGHKVDLNDYDVLILVDVYKNVCGMSVVGQDFERLKRYNLAEIYEPTAKESAKESAKETSKEQASKSGEADGGNGEPVR
ncbi:hypothetical protein K490DRAFT_75190 [Saccharata proteae CBS 121410]|uniref:THUMP domain-containing protein n=1 Tax=Saccharata proteae CBS 121410 TaxID=1314787 RepID=A0A9P4HRY2_9PEZI|nr:hypothetical protein K490DRAFT_75190 [Saccharata proteae CBS 121410]